MAGSNPVRFAVVTTQRSGSVFFESVLNSTGRVYCFPEIFYPYNMDNDWCFYNFWLRKIKEDSFNITHFRLREVLREYFDFVFGSVSGKKAIGVDVKYNHFGLFPYQNEVVSEKIEKVIHLVRKNILKTQISFLICEKRNELGIGSHVINEVQLPKFVLPLDDKFIKILKFRRSQIADFRRILKEKFDFVEIYYEDLKDGKLEEVVGAVFDFLGVGDSCGSCGTDLKKIAPDDLRDLIENYDEVQDFLRAYGFGYLLYFDDVPVPGLEWEGVNDKEGLLILGRDFLRQGDYDSAVKSLGKALSLDPTDRDIVMLFGKMLERLGRRVEALRVYKDFSLLRPDDEEIKARVRSLEKVP